MRRRSSRSFHALSWTGVKVTNRDTRPSANERINAESGTTRTSARTLHADSRQRLHPLTPRSANRHLYTRDLPKSPPSKCECLKIPSQKEMQNMRKKLRKATHPNPLPGAGVPGYWKTVSACWGAKKYSPASLCASGAAPAPVVSREREPVRIIERRIVVSASHEEEEREPGTGKWRIIHSGSHNAWHYLRGHSRTKDLVHALVPPLLVCVPGVVHGDAAADVLGGEGELCAWRVLFRSFPGFAWAYAVERVICVPPPPPQRAHELTNGRDMSTRAREGRE
ncbi:hypothetical protein K438DRAFT_1768529 [Mycena galopus ATCC 62051]|nr:hypothetical protein K438DRAFT_1768529 [Mycena galopus ATCC 62051]